MKDMVTDAFRAGMEATLFQEYKDILNDRLEAFKTNMLQNNFVPGTEEVWKMYEDAFSENTGIYYFIVKLLNLELYDKHGRLNECHIFLDQINKDLFDFCSEYVQKNINVEHVEGNSNLETEESAENFDDMKWHEENGDKVVERDSSDWMLAEKYKRHHPNYSSDNIIIDEVWRDKNNILCVKYTTHFNRPLDWFHYVEKDNDVTWW